MASDSPSPPSYPPPTDDEVLASNERMDEERININMMTEVPFDGLLPCTPDASDGGGSPPCSKAVTTATVAGNSVSGLQTRRGAKRHKMKATLTAFLKKPPAKKPTQPATSKTGARRKPAGIRKALTKLGSSSDDDEDSSGEESEDDSSDEEENSSDEEEDSSDEEEDSSDKDDIPELSDDDSSDDEEMPKLTKRRSRLSSSKNTKSLKSTKSLKNTKSGKNTKSLKSLKNARRSNKAKRAPPSEKAVALAKKVANANAKKAAGHAKAAAFACAAVAANPTSSSKDKGTKRKVSSLISHTNESDTDDDVIAVDSSSDAEVYTLINPCGKTSKWWAHYSLFHQKHSDMQQYARCKQIGCEHHFLPASHHQQHLLPMEK